MYVSYVVCMAIVVYIANCTPIKRSLVDELAATDCYGTECYYDAEYYDKDVIVNVNIPDNITDVIVNFIPEMMERQENVTQLFHSQMERQNQQISNLRGDMNQHMQIITNVMANMTQLLQSQLAILNGRMPAVYPQNCQDVLAKKLSYGNGVYNIHPTPDTPLYLHIFQVYCDMETEGGPWTVFQKRFDGSVDFYQNWIDYENGFGSVEGEYWLGLKHIYQLTQFGTWQLRVDMESFDGDVAYALYESFSIDNAASNYRLHVSGHSGTADDSLTYHNGMEFSTRGRDNDAASSRHCAEVFKGGYWYRSCYESNLNGRYLGPSGSNTTGNNWHAWKGYKALKTTEMKIRRIN